MSRSQKNRKNRIRRHLEEVARLADKARTKKKVDAVAKGLVSIEAINEVIKNRPLRKPRDGVRFLPIEAPVSSRHGRLMLKTKV